MTTPYRTSVDNGMRFGAMSIVVKQSITSTVDGPRKGSDIVTLAGFFDGVVPTYESYPVTSVDQVVSDLSGNLADTAAVKRVRNSELFRALIACKSQGGSDVLLFKLGTLEEWELCETEDERMELAFSRLRFGGPIAVDNDYTSFFVPVDAIAEGYLKETGEFLDFLAETADIAATAMSNGSFVESLLSTGTSDGTLLLNSESMRRKEDWQFRDPSQSFCFDPRVGWMPNNDKYRFVAVPTGRALFTSFEYGAFFEQGLAPAVAGKLSSLPTDVSIAGRVLDVSKMIGPAVLGSMADDLSEAGYMPVGQSASMRRGKADGALVLGDNTMAIHASDFQQEVVLRLTRRVSSALRLALDALIGTPGIGLESAVEGVLEQFRQNKFLKSYTYRIGRDVSDIHRIKLFVEVSPFLPVKAIEISIVTGPFVQ